MTPQDFSEDKRPAIAAKFSNSSAMKRIRNIIRRWNWWAGMRKSMKIPKACPIFVNRAYAAVRFLQSS